MDEKVCPGCGVVGVDNFTVDRSRRDGLKRNCRRCCAARLKQWKISHPETVARHKKKYRTSRETIKKCVKAWQKRNQDKVNGYHRKKSARRRRDGRSPEQLLIDCVVAKYLGLRVADAPKELIDAKRAQILVNRQLRKSK